MDEFFRIISCLIFAPFSAPTRHRHQREFVTSSLFEVRAAGSGAWRGLFLEITDKRGRVTLGRIVLSSAHHRSLSTLHIFGLRKWFVPSARRTCAAPLRLGTPGGAESPAALIYLYSAASSAALPPPFAFLFTLREMWKLSSRPGLSGPKARWALARLVWMDEWGGSWIDGSSKCCHLFPFIYRSNQNYQTAADHRNSDFSVDLLALLFQSILWRPRDVLTLILISLIIFFFFLFFYHFPLTSFQSGWLEIYLSPLTWILTSQKNPCVPLVQEQKSGT